DDPAHIAGLELLGVTAVVVGRDRLCLGRGGTSFLGGRDDFLPSGLTLLGGGLDVGTHNPALGARALDLGDVETVLLGQPAGQGRGTRTRPVDGGRGGARLLGGSRLRGLLLGFALGFLLGLVLTLVLGGSTCPCVLGHGIRRIPEDADDLTDRNGLTLGGRLLDEVAVLVGLVLHDGLVGLDLDQDVSGGD